MNGVSRFLFPSLKAIMAGAVAAAGAGATATVSDDRVSTGEWWMIAAAGLGAIAATWATPNLTSAGKHAAKEAIE